MRGGQVLEKMRWSWRLHGFSGTAASVAAQVASRLGYDVNRKEWFVDYMARRFDRRFGVDTAGHREPEELGLADDIAHCYMPTTATMLPLILERLDIPFEQYTFIDLGSGKGRVLITANEFPFADIVGVELSEELHRAAIANLTAVQKHGRVIQFRLVYGDARDYEFPSGPLVVYMFNPFPSIVIRTVLDNLQASLEADPRPVVLIYYNPVYREVPDSMPFLRRREDDVNGNWAVYDAIPTRVMSSN